MAQQVINNGETGLVVRNKINANFGETYANEPLLTRASVVTTASPITLDMNLRTQRMFAGATSFAVSRTIALSNAGNALVFNFHFDITALAATLVLPSNFTMADALWNTTTNTWTPTVIGKYEMGGSFDGTNWKVKIIGPFT